jgi:hypothetical protein
MKSAKALSTAGGCSARGLGPSAGADVLVAQGWEAGGNAGWVAAMVLAPQIVDAAGDVPVPAAQRERSRQAAAVRDTSGAEQRLPQHAT